MRKTAKRGTHAALLREGQRLFNKLRRLECSDAQGFIKCPLCGVAVHYTEADCMHYFAVGAFGSVRFERDNTLAGCRHCNQTLSGALDVYREVLLRTHGEDWLVALQKKANTYKKHDRWWLEERIPVWRRQIRELESQLQDPW